MSNARLDLQVGLNRYRGGMSGSTALFSREGAAMKAKLVGLMAMVLAVFGTTPAAAATKVAASGGCCPLCR